MSAIDKMVSATSAIAGINIEIENEHLGKIRVKPAISCAKAGEIREEAKSKGLVASMCLELFYRCTDMDGKPLFAKADIQKMLLEVDSTVMTELYNQVLESVYSGKSTAAKSDSTTG